MLSRLHMVVRGTVQGVFFRANTEETAKKLGIEGWVRNNPDGSVEVMAEGEKEALQRLLEWCSRGPEGASVETVESEWLQPAGGFRGFEIRYQ